MKAFLARDLNGELFLCTPNPPIKERTQWILSSASDKTCIMDDNLFPEVKWEDKEPTEINIEIVNKHQ